jgi:hypothetical protein
MGSRCARLWCDFRGRVGCRGSRIRSRRRIRGGLPVERLEPRLALAITLPVQDLTGLDPSQYDIWVAGHGIPGWQPAGEAPQYLMALGATGAFTQVATSIESATSSGTTATITTVSPHGLKTGEQVFIAGVAPGGYDGVFTIAFESPTSFTITTSGSDLGPATSQQGSVYASSMIATQTISSATSLSFDWSTDTGLAEVTTTAPHGLSVGQTVEITGVTPDGYNGVFSVAQVPSSTTFEVSYSATKSLADGKAGTLRSVALQPVNLSQLPGGITLDEGLTNVSSKLIVFVTPAGSSPTGLPFNANTVTPTDPPTAPYSPSLLAPSSVVDIVEFAYLPWGATTEQITAGFQATITTTLPHGLQAGDSANLSGVVDGDGTLIAGYNQTFTVTSVLSPLQFTFAVDAPLPSGGSGTVNPVNPANAATPISSGFSTFDVSAVDGLAIPMTLTADQVKPSMVNGALTTIDSVGIRQVSGFSRDAIGHAFTQFMTTDPLGHVDASNPASRDFSKLLYKAEEQGPAITGVAASWSNNTATFTYNSASPILQYEWVEISGFAGSESGFNGLFQVQTATSTSFTVTNTNSSLTTASGGTVAPVLFQAPSLLDGQFVAITAPKDWLANQVPAPSKTPPGLASQDPLATFWDETVTNFFQSGNFLSIYLGKDTTHPIYSGSSDGTQFTLSNGVNTYSFPKPTDSLGNAMYVWSQADAPSGDAGLLQDQIWQALCRGVALDGVSSTAVTNGESSTAWNDSANWYTQHTSTAFPAFDSVYCPYSKFLHYSTLAGSIDTTGTNSIFLHNAAYGFGEDENPIGNPYNGPLVPSKLDGTVYDDSSVTITLAPWTTPTIVSGDFNGDGLTDIASRDQTTGMWSAAITAGDSATSPTTVPMKGWSTKFTYDDIAAADFTGDGMDDIVGRDSLGRWWLLADTGNGYTNTMIGRWAPDVAWVDVVVGNFDGDAGNKADIAGRTPTGTWWYLHDNGGQFVNEKMARWSVGTAANPVTWSDIVVGNFDGAVDGRDEIAGRNSRGQWWMLGYDTSGSQWGNSLLGGWATKQQWVDVVAGKFDDSGRDTIAGRTANDVWWLLSYDTQNEQFTNKRMGRWNGGVSGWASVVVGDFDGNGFDDVAGRNTATGAWNVTGLVNGAYTTSNFTSGGGAWPTSNVWALAFAGLYDTQAKGPPAMWGILGRSISGSWVRSLSDGAAFTTEAVTGYP